MLKEYVGYVWIGDAPGIRVSILAEDASDAGEHLRRQYGEGHVYSIRNEDDARKPREPEGDGVTYEATIRPGSADSQSVEGLGDGALDAWLVMHGKSGDAFTYCSVESNGRVIVRGEGRIQDGEVFYRLAP